jgi:hypothetical protein
MKYGLYLLPFTRTAERWRGSLTIKMITEDLAFRVLRRIASASDRHTGWARVEVAHAPFVVYFRNCVVVCSVMGRHCGGRGLFRGRGKDRSSKSSGGTLTSWTRIVRAVAHIAKLTPHH